MDYLQQLEKQNKNDRFLRISNCKKEDYLGVTNFLTHSRTEKM